MKYKIVRRAILQEDEGHEHDVGEVEAENEAAALTEAVRLFGEGGYFSASDFRVASNSSGNAA